MKQSSQDGDPLWMRHLLFASLLLLAGCQHAPPPPISPSHPSPPAVHGQPKVRFEDSSGATSSLQLSASDGTGLKLVDYQARAVLQGPLAYTELHLTFANPEKRVLEGRFQIRLPEKAALSRFAMKTDLGWQEAEVVELQQARRVYEDYLHRRQDPALLEKEAGNLFQARVFPIPAAGTKQLILAYSEELPAEQPYRLALAGLPKLEHFQFEGLVWTRPDTPPLRLSNRSDQQAPSGDLLVEEARWSRALVADELALVPVRVPESDRVADISQPLILAVDTSASRSLERQRQDDLLQRYVDTALARDPERQIQLVAFDQEVVSLYSGPVRGLARGLAQLRQRSTLGGTDLSKLCAWLSKQTKYPQALVVTDGVSTMGGPCQIQGGGLQRLDVLLAGGLRDRQKLEPLVYHGLPRCGWILEPEDNLSRLDGQPLSDVRVEVAGAQWVWPAQLDGVTPGEERIVYARLASPQQNLSVKVGGQEQQVEVSSVQWPLLKRSVAAADLARQTQLWQAAPADQKKSLAEAIVKLSCQSRVLCDLTGMLVLENDAEYARFGLQRNALADILVVGPEGLQLEHRQQAVTPPAPPPDKPKIDLGLPARKLPQAGPQLAPGYDAEEGLLDHTGPPVAGSVPSTSYFARPVSAPRPRLRGNAIPGYSRELRAPDPEAVETQQPQAAALTGQMQEIEKLLRQGKSRLAVEKARAWQKKEPGNVLALVALGRALQQSGHKAEALRAFGSIVDLYPGRADLRRYAGCLLESVGPEGQELALDTFEKALEQRPDHPSSYRLTAYALVRLNRLEEAYQLLDKSLKQDYPTGRFREVLRILREDRNLVGAALAAQTGKPVKGAEARPSTRFVLSWETDANDVDFHIRDNRGGHAFYSQPKLASGGELYADVTTGYGPECFAIQGPLEAGPYAISIHYYSRGPMGYGMGKVEILRHDGKGHLKFEQRPFLVMNDHAYVDLGQVGP